jgi:hypothetical protein
MPPARPRDNHGQRLIVFPSRSPRYKCVLLGVSRSVKRLGIGYHRVLSACRSRATQLVPRKMDKTVETLGNRCFAERPVTTLRRG